MLQQKVVIKFAMNGPKSRTKAMKIAVSIPGVISAELQGSDKNEIVVIGEGIDSTILTMSIRKKICCTELVSVTPIPEKNVEKNKPPTSDDKVQPMVWNSYSHGTPDIYWTEVRDHNQDFCSIM
ncbi:hypothetical protein IFM89_031974 [Coptis chinensis]|uniref:HMA domain-containing protein n=1 Tax=Coptis chinensis TaxID=261450 RepID=A0A835H9I2_9MAGN|nr:hypothetical protein IFM89_003513 [Coptis chinensis]KAF9598854.1 hypothetical protein IFM89_031974 [Coptis chinensis]